MADSPHGARQAKGGRRYYVWGRGERYWSVTTILQALPKDALKWWAAGSVAEFAFDHAHQWLSMERYQAVDYLKREPFRWTGVRAEIGSALHRVAESYALRKPLREADLEEGSEVRAMTQSFLEYLEAIRPTFAATEAQVYNRTQRYAGTLDSIQDLPLERLEGVAHPWDPRPGLDHVRILIDYKTGKGVYHEAALQLNAYAAAEFLGRPDGAEEPLPEIDGAAVLHITADGWDLVPVQVSPEIFRSFLYVREVFRYLEVASKEVLGTPFHIAPPAPPTHEGEQTA